MYNIQSIKYVTPKIVLRQLLTTDSSTL